MSELGAHLLEGGAGAAFRVWAPHARTVEIELGGPGRRVAMQRSRGRRDVFEIELSGVAAGAEYAFALDGGPARPDPRSRFQPRGVHGPSALVDPAAFAWSDADFRCPELCSLVLYELHIGTFTAEGTFAAAIPKLRHLKELGVNAVEIMPVAEFPGARNWGYDGVCLYAPHSAYGGPEGLKRLIDACHGHGLAVVLDVVYNHIGPEGNYLREFGPYFTDRYKSAWGDAINFDGPHSDEVRRFFIDNALYWLREYHVDALRLDAVHGIFDFSARHVLEEMQAEVQAQAARLRRPAYLIAESDLNDVRVIKPPEQGGFGMHAQWSDDFHHALRTLLVPERRGYLADFGRLEDLKKAMTDGFVYDGRYSEYRKRRHGNASAGMPGWNFVVYIQNHDQIANASQGKRIAQLVPLEAQKLAAAVVACAPNLPLLFMGEEFGAVTPFHYFVSHSDPALVEAVQKGRRAEHESFGSDAAWADPQAEETFEACKLDWSCIERAPHRDVLALYRDLLSLRRRYPALSGCNKELVRAVANESEGWLAFERAHPSGADALCVFNFGSARRRMSLALAPGHYALEIATWDARYGGDPNAPAPPRELHVTDRAPAVVQVEPTAAAIYARTRG